MYFLDTDILIGHLRNNLQAKHKIQTLLSKDQDVYTSVINIHELIKGAYLSQTPENNMEKVNVLLQAIDVLSFDKQAAFISGPLSAFHEKKGSMIAQNDLFIASLALSRNLILITRNIKHFEGIERLQIESW